MPDNKQNKVRICPDNPLTSTIKPIDQCIEQDSGRSDSQCQDLLGDSNQLSEQLFFMLLRSGFSTEDVHHPLFLPLQSATASFLACARMLILHIHQVCSNYLNMDYIQYTLYLYYKILMFYVIFVGFVVGITTIQIHYNDQQMYPFDEGEVQKCKQCGIVYGMKLREMQWVEVMDEGEFVVSVWGENEDVHASGWGEAMHPSEGSNYRVKILLRSQCITYEKAEVSFEVLFRLWRKDASYEDIAVPARLLCVEQEQLNTIRQTLARIYSIIWVTALSLLPVFPIINIRLQAVTFLFITCMTLFEIHLFLHSLGLITLLMVLIVYLRQQFWVEFPTSVVLEANLSANANITLLISYTCILVISLLLFSSNSMQMGPFESLCIHIRNWILLMIYGCLWCRLVWLNRFRHLFWYLILLWGSLWLLPYYQHHHLGYFSLLLPQFYTTTCSYTNIGMSFMVLPIARYLQRCDKKYQILGTLALVGTVLLPPVHAFVGTVILVVSWILLECGRIGFQQMLQYRWLTLLSFQRLQ